MDFWTRVCQDCHQNDSPFINGRFCTFYQVQGHSCFSWGDNNSVIGLYALVMHGILPNPRQFHNICVLVFWQSVQFGPNGWSKLDKPSGHYWLWIFYFIEILLTTTIYMAIYNVISQFDVDSDAKLTKWRNQFLLCGHKGLIYDGEILPHDIQHHHMRHHMHCTWVHIRLLELHIPRHRSYPFLVPNTRNMLANVYSCSHVTTFNSFRSFEIIQGLNEFCRANNNCIILYSIFVSQKSRELLWKISHIIYSCISTLYSWV